ncbi:MAG: Wzz/FepE/Etk N-terminal domain-containing protein, partial [bacterium]
MSTEKDQEGLGKNPETEALQKGKQPSSDEIDLIQVFLAFWKERRILYITLGVFAVIGIIKAFTTVEEYTAEVKLLPEERQQQGATSGLARQFGMENLQTGRQEGIETRYYPDLAKSIPFIKPILDHKIYVKELDDSLTIENYFNVYHSDFNFFGLLGPKKGSFKESTAQEKIGSDDSEENEAMRKRKANDPEIDSLRPFRDMEHTIDLTEKESRAIYVFKERIEAEYNEDEGIIHISVEMPDPVLAAELTGKVT